jgi:hypothetical protein
MTSHPLRNVFEAMMEKGQDEEFLITKITISLQKDYNCNQIDGYFA